MSPFVITGDQPVVLAGLRGADGAGVEGDPGDVVDIHDEDVDAAGKHPRLKAAPKTVKQSTKVKRAAAAAKDVDAAGRQADTVPGVDAQPVDSETTTPVADETAAPA